MDVSGFVDRTYYLGLRGQEYKKAYRLLEQALGSPTEPGSPRS
ncbi:hypothetical protein AB0469_39810 [Streptomyces sp. NPDC093801]